MLTLAVTSAEEIDMSIRSANIFVLMLCLGGLAGCTKNDFETQWSECEMEAAKHFPDGFRAGHKAGYYTDPDGERRHGRISLTFQVVHGRKWI